MLKDNYEYKNDDVMLDDNLVTSRGPGTTVIFKFKKFDFAFALVEVLKGSEIVKKVREPMMFSK